MKLKNFQIAAVGAILANLSLPTTITVDSITSLVSATASLQASQKTYEDSTKALMTSYGLSVNESNEYNWSKHKKSKEISEKWTELSNKDITIDVKFKETDLYAKLGAGLHIQQVLLLKEVLA
jgi:hypothetical protein